MVALAGPCAIETREPRQARKGATVVIFLCAAARLVSAATLFFLSARWFRHLCELRLAMGLYNEL